MSFEDMMKYGLNRRWGLVLVDHVFKFNRCFNVINFANLSQIVVVHDSENKYESKYQYRKYKINDYFKYACKFSLYTTETLYKSTTILSNYVDVTQYKLIFDKVSSDYKHVSCDTSL